MQLVDANVLLRYLLNDIPAQAAVARQAIESGAAVEVLGDLCPKLICSRLNVLIEALEAYGSTSLDFVECVLLASAKVEHADVLTFDKKLQRAFGRL